LEDSRVRRLGAKSEVSVDVRVIAATNKVVEEALKKQQLREDLYYRLNVFQVHLPPLRQRREDIPSLIDALIPVLNAKHSCKATEVQASVMDIFRGYDWPGNVRELRNVLERAVILVGEGPIRTEHLPAGFGGAVIATPATESESRDSVTLRVGTTVSEAEKALIFRTLDYTGNNKTRAAEILGISLKTLHNKLKEYSTASAAAAE
jgi:transcriptional regulator with PAS, ATPase and Fis domain